LVHHQRQRLDRALTAYTDTALVPPELADQLADQLAEHGLLLAQRLEEGAGVVGGKTGRADDVLAAAVAYVLLHQTAQRLYQLRVGVRGVAAY